MQNINSIAEHDVHCCDVLVDGRNELIFQAKLKKMLRE